MQLAALMSRLEGAFCTIWPLLALAAVILHGKT